MPKIKRQLLKHLESFADYSKSLESGSEF